MGEFNGRVALVTGSGPNIGREISFNLAKEGAIVLCNDIDEQLAEESAQFIRKQGYQAEAMPADVSDFEQVKRMVENANKKYGCIDALVNNAAITIPKGLLTISFDEWRKNISVILDGMYLTSSFVAQTLITKNKPGAIVNVASTSGHRGRKNAIAYTTAKGGVLNFTRSMAVELASYNIRVNSVSPTKTGASVGSIEGKAERNFSEIPLGRLGEPQDQAYAVLFLLSDKAAFITGEDIRVDGGSLATWGTRSHPDPVTK